MPCSFFDTGFELPKKTRLFLAGRWCMVGRDISLWKILVLAVLSKRGSLGFSAVVLSTIVMPGRSRDTVSRPSTKVDLGGTPCAHSVYIPLNEIEVRRLG